MSGSTTGPYAGSIGSCLLLGRRWSLLSNVTVHTPGKVDGSDGSGHYERFCPLVASD